MPRYRKKPVVIEAWAFNPYLVAGLWKHEEPPNWIEDNEEVTFTIDIDGVPVAYIDTKEGTMRADPGDYIIQGVNGELYPCKPEIFEKTYEPVEGNGNE